MSEDERNALAAHRIGQAGETVSETELLIAHSRYRAGCQPNLLRHVLRFVSPRTRL